ncbi:alpha/beta hydrolase [Rhodanobacter sp. AS-Z3]|uniref:alpha/beta fold hydrolase n=1 Tax=Rhodanobacter sp. AS-Z3 TaxID=3031330 RepID=UPI00247978A2|nr:alpha/beta hydrolase [Rhodanobacter sp. AS-Z3]WEN14272.1 alpha/beta hydrolase [Rhodanobacter sp. AS-Z3]
MERRLQQGRHGWRTLRRIGRVTLVLLLVLGTAGAVWNVLAIRHYRKAFPPPGKLFTVNGNQMHLYCSGAGSPTVVLESGLGDDFLTWGKVQPALSLATRVCSYDRAGLGWSEPQSGPRDATPIASQLHELLQQAQVKGPLLLMGHSAGGIYIRAYASRYPHEVAGLVFVDASSPTQDSVMPANLRALDERGGLQVSLMKALMWLGVDRVLGVCDQVPPGFEAQAGLLKADACIPAQVDAYQGEQADWSASLLETAQTGPYGDLPILVFSRDPNASLPSQLPAPVTAAELRQGMLIWDGLQQQLAQLSTHGQRIIAKGSGHYIQLDRPDVLNRAVAIFIQQVRKGSVLVSDGRVQVE